MVSCHTCRHTIVPVQVQSTRGLWNDSRAYHCLNVPRDADEAEHLQFDSVALLHVDSILCRLRPS